MRGPANKNIYDIGGVNGAGKSSLTGALKAERSDLGQIIDVDKLAIACGSSVAGGRKAIQKSNDCLVRRLGFTQETTLSGIRTERTMQKAKEMGYYIRLYYVGLNTAQESVDRIKNRVSKGGHDIPQKDVQRRFSTRFRDVIRVLPYCDKAVFLTMAMAFYKLLNTEWGTSLDGRKPPSMDS